MRALAHYHSWNKEFNDFEFRLMEFRTEEYESAISWLKEAANKGSTEAMLLLGKCFTTLAKKNVYERNNASIFYEMALEAGCTEIMSTLFDSLKQAKNHDKLFELMKKYAPQDNEQRNHWRYSFELALYYEKAGEKEEAFTYFLAASNNMMFDTKGISQRKCGDYYYEKGEYLTAVTWYKNAILKGDVEARAQYKKCAKEGQGETKEGMLQFCQEHSMLPWARGQVAIAYLDGILDGKPIAQVFGMLKEAYESDLESRTMFSTLAMDDHLNRLIGKEDIEFVTRLGDCYYKGMGTQQDYAKALECYRVGTNISLLYRSIDDLHPQPWKASRDAFLPNCKWTFKSKDTSLHRAVEFTCCLVRLEKYVEAVAGLHLLVKEDKHYQYWACTELGRCFLHGLGIGKDVAQGYQYVKKAAAGNEVGGQNLLGFCYMNGIGTSRDDVQAFYWFDKAATSPNAYAIPMKNVAFCYEEGRGVAQDYVKALEWYQKAVEKGDQSAQGKVDELQSKAAEQLKKETISLSIKEIANKIQEKKEEIEGTKIPQKQTEFEGSAHVELEKLIGLASVKKEVATMEHLLRINQMRKEAGLPVSEVSKHMVFTGNPGTGKTTVARIIAQIYKENGVLSKGQLVETDRGGLVEGYIGQTAPKTTKKVNEALGGVLFIDEAYALTPEDDARDFGQEAVNTLLKLMEDHKDDLVVIVAGYSAEMQRFIDSNPGLKSRFTTYIDFPDYTSEEMQQIFDATAEKNQYMVTEGAREALKELWEASHAFANAGNGRAVRNVYEKVQRLQATRIVESGEMSREALVTILAEDIPKKEDVFH
jgi:TPR repeat protein